MWHDSNMTHGRLEIFRKKIKKSKKIHGLTRVLYGVHSVNSNGEDQIQPF